jgi:membrane protease YdiL (CAAX protease family)
MNSLTAALPQPRPHSARPALLALLAVVAFSGTFLALDQTYYRFVAARFPPIGESPVLASVFGLAARAHLILALAALWLWRPHWLAFHVGRIGAHARLLLVMLAANCGLVGGFLFFSGGATPYSGNQWLLTEVVTVPLVEEVFWRGLVLSALFLVLDRAYPHPSAWHLSIWLGGLAFGLLHAGNALAGVPSQFVIVQTLNAVIWGVAYGYARALTGSIYPPIILHAAMNLVVTLF